MKLAKYTLASVATTATVVIFAGALFLASAALAFDLGDEQERIDNAFYAKLDAAAAELDTAIMRADTLLNNALGRHLSDGALDRAFAAYDSQITAAQARYDRVHQAAAAEYERALAALERRLVQYDAQQKEQARRDAEQAERDRIREEQEQAERERQAVIDAQRERERLAAQGPGDFGLAWGNYCGMNICFFPMDDELSVQAVGDDGEVLVSKMLPLSGHREDGRGTDGGHIAYIHSMSDGDSYLSWGYWAISNYGPLSHDHRIVEHHSAFAGGNHPAHNVEPVIGTATYHGRMDGVASMAHSGEKWTKPFHDQYIRFDADFDANTIRGWGTLHLAGNNNGRWINRAIPHAVRNDHGQAPRLHWGRFGLADVNLRETSINPDGTFSGRGIGYSSHGGDNHDLASHELKWGGRFYNPDEDPTAAPHATAGGFSTNSTFNPGGHPEVTVVIDAAFGASREE